MRRAGQAIDKFVSREIRFQLGLGEAIKCHVKFDGLIQMLGQDINSCNGTCRERSDAAA